MLPLDVGHGEWGRRRAGTVETFWSDGARMPRRSVKEESKIRGIVLGDFAVKNRETEGKESRASESDGCVRFLGQLGDSIDT